MRRRRQKGSQDLSVPGVRLALDPGRIDPEDPVENADLLAVAAGRVQAKGADLLEEDVVGG